MSDVKLALICSAEREVLGWLEGKPRREVNRRAMRDIFEPEDLGDRTLPKGVFWTNGRDGVMLMCPTCGNAIVGGLEGQDIDDAIKDDLRLVLGFFRLPDPSQRRVYQKGEPTPNKARLEDVAEYLDDEQG